MSELLRGLSSEALRSNPDFFPVRVDDSVYQAAFNGLSREVYGQDRALGEIARAWTRSQAGFVSPNRPEFISLFAGEPGVGKTEVGIALAKLIGQDKWRERLLILDSANFSESHSVFKITGSPNSYIGYGDPPLINPEFLAKRNVIVVDEVEKGHPAYHKLWLSVMDKGHLSVPVKQNNQVAPTDLNFANTSLIFTTNIGSKEIRDLKAGRHLGLAPVGSEKTSKPFDIGIKAIQEHFRHLPEFLNRLDAITVFDSLTPPVFERIFDKFLDEYVSNQTRGHNPLFVTNEVKAWIISKTNQYYGGRELKREMDKRLITPAALAKLSVFDGQILVADLDPDKEDELVFWSTPLPEGTEVKKNALRLLPGGTSPTPTTADRSSRSGEPAKTPEPPKPKKEEPKEPEGPIDYDLLDVNIELRLRGAGASSIALLRGIPLARP